jgi:hypothetical protein
MKEPLVSPDRASVIRQFGEELAALCRRHSLEIVPVEWFYFGLDGAHTVITVVDHGRKEPRPEGYEFDAHFEGTFSRLREAPYVHREYDIVIRQLPKPPSFEEVIRAGYTPSAAERIVAEEQLKYDRGEKPYGPNARSKKQ